MVNSLSGETRKSVQVWVEGKGHAELRFHVTGL